jgi:hypothetical protein
MPGPPGAQLGGATQASFEQFKVLPLHATPAPHWPHASHVWTALATAAHCFIPGVHTGAGGHEHTSHSQFVPHACVP